MHRDRNIITKGVIVEQINTEEQHYVDQPAPNRHSVGFYEERGPGAVELRDVPSDSDEEKLHKSQERPYEKVRYVSAYSNRVWGWRQGSCDTEIIPLAGSTLWTGQDNDKETARRSRGPRSLDNRFECEDLWHRI